MTRISSYIILSIGCCLLICPPLIVRMLRQRQSQRQHQPAGTLIVGRRSALFARVADTLDGAISRLYRMRSTVVMPSGRTAAHDEAMELQACRNVSGLRGGQSMRTRAQEGKGQQGYFSRLRGEHAIEHLPAALHSPHSIEAEDEDEHMMGPEEYDVDEEGKGGGQMRGSGLQHTDAEAAPVWLDQTEHDEGTADGVVWLEEQPSQIGDQHVGASAPVWLEADGCESSHIASEQDTTVPSALANTGQWM